MGLREDFDKAICDEVPGIVDAVEVYRELDDADDRRAAMMRVAREAIATSDLVQRLTTLAHVHYVADQGLVEIYAHLDSYKVPFDDHKKEIQLAITVSNDKDNLLRLATLGRGLINLRGTQTDLTVAKSSAPESSDEGNEDGGDDHPDQMTLDDAVSTEDEPVNLDLSGEPTYEAVEDEEPQEDDSGIIVEPFGAQFLAHGPDYVNPHDSVCGRGDTKEEAIEAYKQDLRMREMAQAEPAKRGRKRRAA